MVISVQYLNYDVFMTIDADPYQNRQEFDKITITIQGGGKRNTKNYVKLA